MLAPTQGNSAETLNLTVVLDNQNDRAISGTLTLARNGQSFKTEAVKLTPGSQTFNYQVTPAEGGLTAFQASFSARDPETDRYLTDDHAVAWVSIRSKAKALLKEAGYDQGFEFTVYLYTLPGLPEIIDIGQALALDWEAVGLKPKLVAFLCHW